MGERVLGEMLWEWGGSGGGILRTGCLGHDSGEPWNPAVRSYCGPEWGGGAVGRKFILAFVSQETKKVGHGGGGLHSVLGRSLPG